MKNESFQEQRGKQPCSRRIETDEMRALIYAHLIEIPHRKSHYKKSGMLYFENSALTVKKLYFLFREFYRRKKGEALSMKLKHYYKIFQQMKFSVKDPKTDVCDQCEMFKIKLRRNPTDIKTRLARRLHLTMVKRYQRMKNRILNNIPEDTRVLEFDYGQNLPLPKLTINKQFYKRLLWLYNLNIHCHNDNESTFYTFLENDGKKDANSIVSYLHHFLQTNGILDNRDVRRIILFSDNANGQNKNWNVVKFCSWLSAQYDLEIEHIFPVRGHSFCVCDRNFGLYGRSIKKTSPITSVDTYLDIMRTCRTNPRPINVVYDHTIMLNYAAMFENTKAFLSKHASFKIRPYRVLRYLNGVVAVSKKYSQNSEPFTVIRRTPGNDLSLKNTSLPTPGLNPKKKEDLLSLIPFIEERNHRTFFKEICQN